jgi:hypothetical protein
MSRKRFVQTLVFAAVVLGLAFAMTGRASAQKSVAIELPLPFVKTCAGTQMDYDSYMAHYINAYPNGTSGGHGPGYWQEKAQGAIADARSLNCDWPDEYFPDSAN